MMLSQAVLAAEEASGGAGLMAILLPVGLIVAFWALLIRPQRKRQREMVQMQGKIEPGQEVLTGSGMIGTVQSIDGEEVVLEIAPGVQTRFVRQGILRVLNPEAMEPDVPEIPDTPAGAEEPPAKPDSDLPMTHDDGKKRKN